jgi:glycosyltransferase involved in cell wall biosynthesis
MSKNILELCLSPDLGGLELFVSDYFQYIRAKTNCYLMIAADTKLDKYLSQDIDKHYLQRNKLFPIFPAIALAKFIDRYQIDSIHSHWTKDIPLIVLAKNLSKKKPSLIHTRHMTMTRFKSDFYHQWLYKNINILHAITHQVEEQLTKFIPHKIRPKIEMVYIGTEEKNVNDSEIHHLQKKYNLNDSFVVGIIGRIEEGKGQYLLIDAVAKLKKMNIKVLIIGAPMNEDYLNSLKKRVEELGIEEKIVFTGFTKEVTEHMHLLDTVVLATKKETFGLVVIEGMMNKVCVIATNNGGPLEIIDNNKTGILFDGSSEDLAKKIKKLYEDSSYKETLSLCGYNKAKEVFDRDTQFKKLYGVMDEN